MNELRPGKQEYYLAIAEQVAMRSTCRRRLFGAVVVKDDEVVSTGYAGAPRGTANCCDIGVCYRAELGARSGEHYEFCRAVHAEQNALLHAARRHLHEAVLYLVGLDAKTKEQWRATEPCQICKRLIVNAGIQRVIAAQGTGRVKEFLVREWVSENLGDLHEEAGGLVPVRPPRPLSEPVDEERRRKLLSRYSLSEAIVVQVGSHEQAKQAIARVAARYFVDTVKSGNSVALSCGETILYLLEALPYHHKLQIMITQLSIEGDHRKMYQAPATLIGILQSKCSPVSDVMGLQLPPPELTPSSLLREALVGSDLFSQLKRRAASSHFIFIGAGSARSDSTSFWSLAQLATEGRFDQFVQEHGIVGEINNRVYDKSGEDCTDLIPGLADHVVAVLTLQDIREMARKSEEHKVVIVATGESKTEAIRVALNTGLANVLITGREDADRLLRN